MKVGRFVPVVVVTSLLSGCMGSFVLTRKLYAFNETITGSKVVNNLIFWGLNILPIYSIAVIGDAVIFNLLEFWTGSNMLADASTAGDARVAVRENDDGSLTVTRGAEVFKIVPQGPEQIDIFRGDERVGSAERTSTGGVVAFDAAGNEVAVLTPEELATGSDVIGAATAAR